MKARGDIFGQGGLNSRCGMHARKKKLKQGQPIYETPGKPKTEFKTEDDVDEHHKQKQKQEKKHHKKEPEVVKGPEELNAVVMTNENKM